LGASGTITDTQSIGATSTNGLVLTNTTAAALGAQQWSPRVHFDGRGWETGTSASQAVDMIEELQPVQGATNPSGNLTWSSSVNGGAYGALMTLTSGGNVGIGTTAPSFPLHIVNSATGLSVDRYGGGGIIEMRRADGTQASPTAVQSGDQISQLISTGYNGTAWPGFSAAIKSAAEMAWGFDSPGGHHEYDVAIDDYSVRRGYLSSPRPVISHQFTKRGFRPPPDGDLMRPLWTAGLRDPTHAKPTVAVAVHWTITPTLRRPVSGSSSWTGMRLMCGRLGDWKGSHRPIGDQVLKVWPVSKKVNTPRNNGAELLEPVAQGLPWPPMPRHNLRRLGRIGQ
jgi:hypothetical protein